MPDLQHDLAELETEYARVEAQLATQQADQEAQLQTLADQFTAENTTLAREMVMLSGAIRHVQGQIARDEQAGSDPSNGHDQPEDDLSPTQHIHRTQDANGAFYRSLPAAIPDNDLSLLQRLTHKQEAERFAAAAIPDNDPD